MTITSFCRPSFYFIRPVNGTAYSALLLTDIKRYTVLAVQGYCSNSADFD